METNINLEIVATIGFISTALISFIKLFVPKSYIVPISRIIPAVLALIVAFMSNYGLQAQLVDFVAITGSAYAISTGVYKLSKPSVK